MLARIDERTRALQIQVLDLRTSLEKHYVTLVEFAPVRRVVYGLVSIALTAIVGAFLAFVFKVQSAHGVDKLWQLAQ